MTNIFKMIKSKTSRSKTIPTASRAVPKMERKPVRTRSRSNFQSMSFLVARLFQLFLSIAILGATIRLAFFTTYSIFQKRQVNDNTILKNNGPWYYIMVGVSAFSLLVDLVTLVLYCTSKLKATALVFTEFLLLLVWLAGIIVWGIAINRFLGWNFSYQDNNDDLYDNTYWYLRSAHLGILGLAIFIFFTYLTTLFIGLKHRKAPQATKYSLPIEQSTVTHHSFQTPMSGAYRLPTSYDPPAGAPPGYNGASTGAGEAASYYGAPPPSYVPGSGPAANSMYK